MLKNMTRKGLALGTGLALVATGFVAAPAQATATGQLWSAFGQTNEMVGVAGHVFTLRFANPTGVVGTDDDGDGTADEHSVELAGVANNVSVKMVENPNVATIAVTPVAKTTLDTASGTGTITAQVEATDTTGDHTATGIIEIAPPTVLTHSIQVEVQVTYDDGSKSEVETITFVPAKTVTAALGVTPVSVGTTNQKIEGTFSLAGINTENFVKSNTTGGVPVNAKAAGKVALLLTNDAAAVAWDTSAYSSITDTYTFSLASQTVASGKVIKLTADYNNGTEINTYFNADTAVADQAEAKFTVGLTDANAKLEISAAGSSLVHNATGTATSLVSAETILAPEGTKSLNFVISALTGAAGTTPAGANIPITVTLRDDVTPVNDLGTTTISSNGKTLNVAGTSISFTLLTNSSGQVAFTVTADKAEDGESFKIDATNSIGDSIDQTTVRWEEAAWTLIPAVAGDFTIAPKGSVAVEYTVVNQFGTLADSNYQIAFTRAAGAGNRDTTAEYANWSYVAPVSSTGRASVTIVDNGAASVEGKDTVTATLQKAATAGGAYLNVAGSTATFVLNYENDIASLTSTAKVNYNGIADAAGTAVIPVYLETDPLVNYDARVSRDKTAVNKWEANNYEADGVADNTPAITDSDSLLRVYGTVVTTNSAPVAGVAVKLSGTGLNFADKAALADITRASNDSFVVFTDATGSYEAFVRGSAAGLQTIAVDAQGAKSSVQVRFQESTGVATGLTLVAPASVNPGARADFVAKVVDKFGKPVSGVTVNFKDNGPGVLSATSAATDPFGDASVTLTTLAAESGTTTVTAWATIGGQTVSVTKTITVGSAAGVTGKVNVGSFNGKLVVYASGLQGSTISWKVGGNWGKGVASSNYSIFNRPTPRAGVTVSVDIYVNGVKTLTKSVVTR